MLPKFNIEACSVHSNQRESRKQTLRITVVSSPLFLFPSPTFGGGKKTCIFTHRLWYSSIKPAFEHKAGVNCMKFYTATGALNRKSLMLVPLSLIESHGLK